MGDEKELAAQRGAAINSCAGRTGVDLLEERCALRGEIGSINLSAIGDRESSEEVFVPGMAEHRRMGIAILGVGIVDERDGKEKALLEGVEQMSVPGLRSSAPEFALAQNSPFERQD